MADVHPDDDALAPLLARLRAHASAETGPLLCELARAAYRRVPAERLASLDPDTASARLRGALAFMDARALDTLALRVFDPDPDADGWSAPGTVVEVNVEDTPFLLSTVHEELDRLGVASVDGLHPVLGVERDDDCHITAIVPARSAPARETFIHLQLETRLDAPRAKELADSLRAVLSDALAATRDFTAMREQVREVAFELRASAGARYDAGEVDEALALLEWLLDDHFVLLGTRDYDLIDTSDGRPALQVLPGSGLGILADEERSSLRAPVPLDELGAPVRDRAAGGPLCTVTRTAHTSTVLRRERMISVNVKRVSGEGAVVGEHRILGLFAQRAFAEPASSVPMLRRKLRAIVEREDIVDHSYDERALRAIFEAIPKAELFEAGVEELRRAVVSLLETQKHQGVRLLVRVDEARRSVAVLVTLPRDRFNARVRRRMQDLLVRSFAATGVDYRLSLTERDQALLHFLLHTGGPQIPDVAVDELEREVLALTRTWEEDLATALAEYMEADEARRVARVWAARFPPSYRDTTNAGDAVADLYALSALAEADPAVDTAVRMAVRADPDHPRRSARFTLYKTGDFVELSGFLPILESLGLTVVDEVVHGMRADGTRLHLHDFGVRATDGGPLDIDTDGPRLADAALAMWQGRTDADSLNRLVLRAGLAWQDVATLRAYRRYRRQVGTSFTEPYQNDALVAYPGIARALIDLFAIRFDPAREASQDDIDAVRARVESECDAVERLDLDRILRGYLSLIDATLRTNRYVVGRADAGHLSLKFDSAAIPGIPKPVPYAEIYVCSPRMEGLHLRGGPVARGGLRHSDRLEDYRTEVLGLMKAQMTKNAVIVPTGSKGGFVLRGPPTQPAEVKQAVRRQYETFIRGLLEVTDTVEPDRTVRPPDRVRRHDGDDPYLVVAADKGTAAFSDVANAVAQEYGFWLGDAFASGGSHGYDHKKMGITARGAWVAVQRHFRELDIDVQSEPITVVGIGDMSGDVFGNGLLRSRAVKLVAAFDHRCIFVDPDPDPRRSFAERRRLYDRPSSSWQDYDRDLLSAGGGVWPRTVKRITLTDEIRALLRVDAEHLSPPELIRALLRAPADLLFAGGIGTFVKASTETSAGVGDRANDAIRVDADEVGARVIGEGGNLALTQRARIQYARRGGRCNTDAIDNSAGVDTSDHEVNIKILLSAAQAAGAMAPQERDELLAAMEDDVAAAVLRDVYLQTWALSQEMTSSAAGIDAYEALLVDLVEAGRLDRDVEALPSTAEMDRRRSAGAGLTRPELAVLLGYAKLDLAGRLLVSPLPDQPWLRRALESYFPPVATRRFGDLLPKHRLRRELIATVAANDLINRMGITYVSRTAHELGCMAFQVAAAYCAAREVADADARWREIEALDGQVDPSVQLEAKAQIDSLVDAFTRAYLHQGGSDIAALVAGDRGAFRELATTEGLGSRARQSAARAKAAQFVARGLDAALAQRLAHLSGLALVPDVAAVARECGRGVRDVAAAFLHAAEVLPLDRLHERLTAVTPAGHWERWQQRGLSDELRQLRRQIAAAALAARPQESGEAAVDAFLADREAVVARATTFVELAQDEQRADLDALAVAVRALREVGG